jgi:uncharacterized protein with HEPN domain
MKPEIKKYLYDIHTAIQSIEEFLGNSTTLEIYSDNKMMRRAVEREFEIIGEAMSNALKLDTSLPISEARRIVNLRNISMIMMLLIMD